MWNAISTLIIAILLMGIIFGGPIYLLLKFLGPVKRVERYPFRKPAVYTNSFGHIVMVHPDQEDMKEIQQYYKDHHEEEKKFLADIREEEKW